MATYNVLCKYSEVAGKIGGHAALSESGIYTGHHLIADHCFMIAPGVRGAYGSLLVVPGYNVNDAPVVVVTADANGGKSREHGEVHSIFDPAEALFESDQEWTYADARKAAVESAFRFLALQKVVVGEFLDAYFKIQLGVQNHTKLRAGERSVFPGYQPRQSSRKITTVRADHRFTPY